MVIANFLSEIFDQEAHEANTVKGYRSAIRSALYPLGLWTDQVRDQLANLVNSMELERPRSRKVLPQWNLALVLQFLLTDEFEPLAEASLRNVSLKTSFLLAIASARRVSELHAIAFDQVVFGQEGVSMRLLPGFIAKTQRPGEVSLPICFPSLGDFVGNDLPDRFLCPVRALKVYVDRTKKSGLRKGRKRLFIPYQEGRTTDLRKNSFSQWIKRTIKAAYDAAEKSEEVCQLHRVSAHETRALSSSWALFSGSSVEAILEAATWRNSTTFTSFYLRDMSRQADGLYRFGALVVANQVVRPHRV